jgi:hypothetical protein
LAAIAAWLYNCLLKLSIVSIILISIIVKPDSLSKSWTLSYNYY